MGHPRQPPPPSGSWGALSGGITPFVVAATMLFPATSAVATAEVAQVRVSSLTVCYGPRELLGLQRTSKVWRAVHV